MILPKKNSQKNIKNKTPYKHLFDEEFLKSFQSRSHVQILILKHIIYGHCSNIYKQMNTFFRSTPAFKNSIKTQDKHQYVPGLDVYFRSIFFYQSLKFKTSTQIFISLTVRLPRFFTLHTKCTFLPTKPVMLEETVLSKYGPVPGVGNSCKKSVRNRLELPKQVPANK